MTKKYLNQKLENLIDNYITEFDPYINNCTEEKIHDNKNIEIILNDYQNIFNVLINNTEEKFYYNISINNNYTIMVDIINKYEKNIFDINNIYYKEHYLNESQFFLEYPDEIVFKINQSLAGLKANNEIIKKYY